jgi:hypothetical protein
LIRPNKYLSPQVTAKVQGKQGQFQMITKGQQVMSSSSGKVTVNKVMTQLN